MMKINNLYTVSVYRSIHQSCCCSCWSGIEKTTAWNTHTFVIIWVCLLLIYREDIFKVRLELRKYFRINFPFWESNHMAPHVFTVRITVCYNGSNFCIKRSTTQRCKSISAMHANNMSTLMDIIQFSLSKISSSSYGARDNK